MSSNEEYLDNLLKSMNDGDKKPEKDSNAIMSPEEIEAMFAAAEKAAGGDSTPVTDTTDEKMEEDLNSADDSGNDNADSTQDMSADEIEKLLQESEKVDVQDVPNTPDVPVATDEKVSSQSLDSDQAVEDDLDALLQNLDQNDDLNEISELLKKADNNEPVEESTDEDQISTDDTEDDVSALPKQGDTDIRQENNDNEKEKPGKRKSKKVKKDKIPKAASSDEAKNGEKKKGVLSKLFSFLTTEEDPEEKTTSENQSIMAELAAEDQEEANKKKKIKKGKMLGKNSPNEDTEEDTDTDKAPKKKEKKSKKVNKPKKEKAPKKVKEEQNEKPVKKISKKSIFVVLLFSASVFTALLFGIYIGSTMIQKNGAIKAFENKDYLTCYEQLYGMKLTDKQVIMFHHAEVVLKMQRRIDMYEKYIEDDKELEALDSLMLAVCNYEELYINAQSYGASDEVADLYKEVLQILNDQYALSEEDARTIADCGSNVDYTRYLTALIGGETVSSEENADGIRLPEQELKDVLPAEEEIIDTEFAD